jgi:hypothetical protein
VVVGVGAVVLAGTRVDVGCGGGVYGLGWLRGEEGVADEVDGEAESGGFDE